MGILVEECHLMGQGDTGHEEHYDSLSETWLKTFVVTLTFLLCQPQKLHVCCLYKF